MSICDNLNKIIKENNISVHKLASEIGIHHSGIYRILNNENKNPGIYTIQKIAIALDVKIDDLV